MTVTCSVLPRLRVHGFIWELTSRYSFSYSPLSGSTADTCFCQSPWLCGRISNVFYVFLDLGSRGGALAVFSLVVGRLKMLFTMAGVDQKDSYALFFWPRSLSTTAVARYFAVDASTRCVLLVCRQARRQVLCSRAHCRQQQFHGMAVLLVMQFALCSSCCRHLSLSTTVACTRLVLLTTLQFSMCSLRLSTSLRCQVLSLC